MSRNNCMAKMFYRFLNEIWLENRMPHNSRVKWQLLLEGRLSFFFFFYAKITKPMKDVQCGQFVENRLN